MRYGLFFSGLLILLGFQVFAQGKNEEKVASRVEQLRKAMIDPEQKTLEGLVMPLLSYGHSGGALDDKTTFVDKLVSGKSDFVSIDFAEQTISVSGKVAIVRHILTGTTNDNNTPGQVKLRILLIWQKDKGDWKLLARQAVKI
jgi:Domain of unknown function (DUF4440)